MTIHAAKGLEFDVVVAADLGRRANLQTPDLLVDGDRLGLRLALLDGRSATPALAYAELRDRHQLAQSQEEERVLYVALTRARERLIVSGAADSARWPREGPGSAPLAWLGPALAPDLPFIPVLLKQSFHWFVTRVMLRKRLKPMKVIPLYMLKTLPTLPGIVQRFRHMYALTILW